MPPPDGSASSRAADRGHGWLLGVLFAGFAGLGCWLVAGALTAPRADAFLIDQSAPIATVAVTGDPAVAPAAPVPDPPPAPLPAASLPAAGSALTISGPGRVDPAWASRVAAATGIPVRAVRAYAGAEIVLAAESPECGLRWSTLAALGQIESGHGTHGGSRIDEDGQTRPGIFGIDLTGEASARITDTDAGRWDEKADIDRAVGPLQFIPQTWERWGADANADGIRDPQHIDDAALAAGRYLCHDAVLTDPAGWRRAVFSYNHLDSYVDAVAAAANDYAGRVTP